MARWDFETEPLGPVPTDGVITSGTNVPPDWEAYVDDPEHGEFVSDSFHGGRSLSLATRPTSDDDNAFFVDSDLDATTGVGAIESSVTYLVKSNGAFETDVQITWMFRLPNGARLSLNIHHDTEEPDAPPGDGLLTETVWDAAGPGGLVIDTHFGPNPAPTDVWLSVDLTNDGVWSIGRADGSATYASGNLSTPTPVPLPEFSFSHFFGLINSTPFVGGGPVDNLLIDTLVLPVATRPVCRQYPRDDGRGTSSAPRIWPRPKAARIIGGMR